MSEIIISFVAVIVRKFIYDRLVDLYLTRGIQNLLRQEAEPDSRGKIRQGNCSRVRRRPKWVPHYGAQA